MNWRFVVPIISVTVFNAIIISVGAILFRNSQAFGVLMVAYVIGLKHAMDADHIAAIDNVTRSLMSQGSRPLTVGLFFSLGHSTIVFLAISLVLITKNSIDFSSYQSFAQIGGPIISSTFLVIVGIVNTISIKHLLKCMKQAQMDPESMDLDVIQMLSKGGPTSHFLLRILRTIDKPWKMYPVGLLFGLGFDTASEIIVLALAVTQSDITDASILVFPLVFTAGICLIDTLDGLLMLYVYGHASIDPLQKLIFNLNVTILSVVVAFGVALIQILSLVQTLVGLEGGFWDMIATVDEHFEIMGIVIASCFVLAFLISWVLVKLNKK
ncbi:high-affinity nickel transport protein [Gorgonomyces haynaldii]|nr:high-affinity nickel transport protein [Gorgonomyces haynaldii]